MNESPNQNERVYRIVGLAILGKSFSFGYLATQQLPAALFRNPLSERQSRNFLAQNGVGRFSRSHASILLAYRATTVAATSLFVLGIAFIIAPEPFLICAYPLYPRRVRPAHLRNLRQAHLRLSAARSVPVPTIDPGP